MKAAAQFSLVRAVPNPLEEYAAVRRCMAGCEARLAEFCTAIEEYDLRHASAVGDTRCIHCRSGAYTPAQLLALADAEADHLMTLSVCADAARNRVQTRLLQQSHSLAEYQSLHQRYIEAAEATPLGEDAGGENRDVPGLESML